MFLLLIFLIMKSGPTIERQIIVNGQVVADYDDARESCLLAIPKLRKMYRTGHVSGQPPVSSIKSIQIRCEPLEGENKLVND